MAKLVWDAVGKRRYEIGLDQGVLYLPDGKGVVWNGLTSLTENVSHEQESSFFDGVKIHETTNVGEFSGTLTAVTYPDEFEPMQGNGDLNCGSTISAQQPQRFGLCYRSNIGNDVNGQNRYKLHIHYGLTAAPSEKNYASTGDSPSMMEFNWSLTAMPHEIIGRRPSSSVTIDSRKTDSALIKYIEDTIFGSNHSDPVMIPMQDLVTLIENWVRLLVNDIGDGTWSVEEHPLALEGGMTPYILDDGTDADGQFLMEIPGVVIIDDMYTLEDIKCVGPEAVVIEIIDNNDGTWTAISEYDSWVNIDPLTGYFTLYNANLTLAGPELYRVSDTIVETP